MNVIEVADLRKSYGSLEVLKGLDLHVAEGEILAFLGSNGAGKTTAIEILEGFGERSSGSVTVLGEDPQSAPLSWRERIGIVLQESEPVTELTARESLVMQAGYYVNPRDVDHVLGVVGLTDSAGQRTRKLSGGQRRRLDLAMALVGDPELVFLDEPTTGFDPTARRESWGMIESLRQMGHSVLLTTHYMDEAQVLADRIVVIAGGVVVANGTADELADMIQAKTRIAWSQTSGKPTPPERLGWTADGEQAVIETEDVVETLYALTAWAKETDNELADLEVVRPNLEDTYLELIRQNEPSDSANQTSPSTPAGDSL
jgi:ABC-2 type transport system ATP-binding protein